MNNSIQDVTIIYNTVHYNRVFGYNFIKVHVNSWRISGNVNGGGTHEMKVLDHWIIYDYIDYHVVGDNYIYNSSFV